ncbi:hypothetical protein [Bifidobacterium tibiigranuli]|jgi:hypothetical protein|uniref:hypothetical protein n=1 Tax=Bifidobacterium tibiigranuli TaxID=2172043 RepID=UPI0026EE4838|nr:hypothetical protein [Bifidobacterium tibiigranuli]MCI2186251.1 hypothetical protein [Bifidobacterium tibiigranuli]MCI2203923.1 hypothetical protein [Bifidobacterium tibiigranuli]
MNGVYEDMETVRADLLVHAGTSMRYGIQTLVQSETGGEYMPLDMSQWTGQFVLATEDGAILWQRALWFSKDGWAVIDINKNVFNDGTLSYTGGLWRMKATAPDNHVERLGEGYWTLS